VMGRKMKTAALLANGTNRIETQTLSSGMYNLMIQSRDKIYYFKIQKSQ
jgi:hypothetical protein